MVDVVKEALNICFYHVPKLPVLQLKRQVADRFIGTQSDSIPIADVQEILLIDGIQQHRDCSLNDFIL